jgi:thioredoxin 1
MNNKFEDFIDGDLPVVVDFFADWCGPCKVMQPVLTEVKNIVGSTATVLKMNVDKNAFYANKYNVQSIPTLIIFKKGKIVWRKSGVTSTHEIVQHLAQNLAD